MSNYREGAARERAKRFLLEALANGPQLAATLWRGAAAAGISRNTLNRARKALGVTTAQEWSAGRNQWVCRLPAKCP